MDETPTTAPTPPRAHIPWRLLALFYDLWPVMALWFLTAVPFMLVDAAIHGDVRHNIEPFSLMQWLLWLTCWAVAGIYATWSWRRGGQTLGMQAWRMRVQQPDGTSITWRQSVIRVSIALVSWLLGGLGIWWSLWDRQSRTWPDIVSGTRTVVLPKE